MLVFRKLENTALIMALFAGIGMVAGCAGEKPDTGGQTSQTTPSTVANDDHSQWWCREHAIPEEVCSMCSSRAAAEFREKGDWCEEHNRAESQCFICDPARAEKFAKLYEAKYGEKPPAASE